jgi:pyridoxine 4-dehydrogenase
MLPAAAAAGVDHIDTAQYYGPGVVNNLIREALHLHPACPADLQHVQAEPLDLCEQAV